MMKVKRPSKVQRAAAVAFARELENVRDGWQGGVETSKGDRIMVIRIAIPVSVLGDVLTRMAAAVHRGS